MRVDVGPLDRLMVFLNGLRRPAEKPADVDALDARLDEVERRLAQRRRLARFERLDAQANLPPTKGR